MPDYNYPQNGSQYPPMPYYGVYPPYYMGVLPVDPRRAAAQKEKNEIKKYALYAALSMLGFLFFQGVLAVILPLSGMMDAYDNDYFFSSGIEILFSVIAVALPFLLIYMLAVKDGSAYEVFGKIKSPLSAGQYIFFGFGVCLLASYLTSWFASLVESTGITLSYENEAPPVTAGAIAVFLLKVAVVPALCEELAIRGCLLQPLRRYGDLFAILVSSAAFSALHANAVLIPFAFMAGIALGYVYCKTNSIWASVAVHFLNNAFSCVCAILYEKYSEDAADRAVLITLGIIASLAILSGALLLIRKKLPLERKVTALTTGKKVTTFISQPLFACMIVLFVVLALIGVVTENTP